jgi:cytochrome oxidase Cu insertion factor (SCO1/SenC/PrrC family)
VAAGAPRKVIADAKSDTRFGRRALLTGVLAATLAVAVALGIYLYIRGDGTASLPRASGLPANLSTPVADELGVSPVQAHRAPNFTLTDQAGRTLSLSSFHGQAVVLEFMDPHCTDICPIVSQEFVDAYRDLGARARTTVFVAVNVNRFHTSTAAMAAYSTAHGLSQLPDWHFFTGPVAALRKVWQEYGVYVYAPNPNADVTHSSVVYWIDAKGRARYVAEPYADHHKNGSAYLPAATMAEWGRGISRLALDLS